MAVAGQMIAWQVPCLRGLAPDLRRGRLIAARAYASRSVPRRAILGGFWDGGSVVRSQMGEG